MFKSFWYIAFTFSDFACVLQKINKNCRTTNLVMEAVKQN